MNKKLAPFIFFLVLFSCLEKENPFDATGVFEAREILVSAEANGRLLDVAFQEGGKLQRDQIVGRIDCADLLLQKKQVEATVEALALKQGDARPELAVIDKQIDGQNKQIEALETQRKVLLRERDRIKSLVDQEAVPAKQLDDLQGKVDVISKQIEAAAVQIPLLQQKKEALKKQTLINNRGLMSETKPLAESISRFENQLSNCSVQNPIDGTVLTQFVEQFEFVNVGKPLYKVADLSDLILRAYMTGDQLSAVSLSDEVTVMVDGDEKSYKEYAGEIVWISDKSEFTPKTIQTKDERANLVYALKIAVKNDGFIRVGMYGEVKLKSDG